MKDSYAEQCCFDVKADRMAAFPFLVPAKGRFSINPTRAIPMQNEVRKLPNDQKDKNLRRLEFV